MSIKSSHVSEAISTRKRHQILFLPLEPMLKQFSIPPLFLFKYNATASSFHFSLMLEKCSQSSSSWTSRTSSPRNRLNFALSAAKLYSRKLMPQHRVSEKFSCWRLIRLFSIIRTTLRIESVRKRAAAVAWRFRGVVLRVFLPFTIKILQCDALR